MAITATSVEKYNSVCVFIHLHVSRPQIPVDKHRRDASSSGLQRTQKARDHFTEEYLSDSIHFRIWATDALLPLDIRDELTAEELLPGVTPFVDHWHDAVESWHMETKPF